MIYHDDNNPKLVVDYISFNQDNLPLKYNLSESGEATLAFFYSPVEPLLFHVNGDNFMLERDELLLTWPDITIEPIVKEHQVKGLLKITCFGPIGVDTTLIKLYSSDLPLFILKQNTCITDLLNILGTAEPQLITGSVQQPFESLMRESLEIWKKDLALLNRVEAQKTCTRHILFTRLRKARLFIDRYYTSPITLPVIARACNMSATYFTRHFTMVFGISPRQYIIQKRVTLAKQLFLQETALKEVVERTGFENDSSFCRLFKKSTGCTSTQYVTSKKSAKTDSQLETY